MSFDNIQFDLSTTTDWKILSISGRIDTLTANTAEEQATNILQTSEKLALDLSNLDYISSAGLRVLLRLAKKTKLEKKAFVLINANGLVREILEESGLDVLFTMLNSQKELSKM